MKKNRLKQLVIFDWVTLALIFIVLYLVAGLHANVIPLIVIFGGLSATQIIRHWLQIKYQLPNPLKTKPITRILFYSLIVITLFIDWNATNFNNTAFFLFVVFIFVYVLLTLISSILVFNYSEDENILPDALNIQKDKAFLYADIAFLLIGGLALIDAFFTEFNIPLLFNGLYTFFLIWLGIKLLISRQKNIREPILQHPVALLLYRTGQGTLIAAFSFRGLHWFGADYLYLAGFSILTIGIILSYLTQPYDFSSENEDVLDVDLSDL